MNRLRLLGQFRHRLRSFGGLQCVRHRPVELNFASCGGLGRQKWNGGMVMFRGAQCGLGRSFGTESDSKDGLGIVSSVDQAKLEKLVEEGSQLVKSKDPAQRARGIKKLRKAAMGGSDTARLVIGKALLEEAELEDKKAFFHALVPSVDVDKKPTGGARDAGETILQIMQMRENYARKKRTGEEDQFSKREEGLMWLQKAYKAGNIEAGLELSKTFVVNLKSQAILEKVGWTPETASEAAHAALEANIPEAFLFMSRMQISVDEMHPNADPEFIEQNRDAAIKLLESAAFGMEYPPALTWLAYIYGGLTDIDVEQDKDLSVQLLEQAAELGFAEAQLTVSGMLALDPAYHEAAKRYLTMAVDQEYGPALTAMGQMYMQPNGLMGNEDVNYPLALRYFERAGMQDHPAGLEYAGNMHFEGLGVPPNAMEAYKCFARAAELGSLEALQNIAMMIYEGTGPFEKDEKLAEELLTAIMEVSEVAPEGPEGTEIGEDLNEMDRLQVAGSLLTPDGKTLLESLKESQLDDDQKRQLEEMENSKKKRPQKRQSKYDQRKKNQ